jgi:F420-non-reducing hydrogenase iron-sulfur subunit
MLEDLGIEPERFKLEWVSASEGQQFAQIIGDFTQEITDLGPSPYA